MGVIFLIFALISFILRLVLKINKYIFFILVWIVKNNRWGQIWIKIETFIIYQKIFFYFPLRNSLLHDDFVKWIILKFIIKVQLQSMLIIDFRWRGSVTAFINFSLFWRITVQNYLLVSFYLLFNQLILKFSLIKDWVRLAI